MSTQSDNFINELKYDAIKNNINPAPKTKNLILTKLK